jgi:hypothetical protein
LVAHVDCGCAVEWSYVTPLPKLGPPVHMDEQNRCFNIFQYF